MGEGLERAVWLEVAAERIPGRFEGGHTKEEKMAGVQFVRFSRPPLAQ